GGLAPLRRFLSLSNSVVTLCFRQSVLAHTTEELRPDRRTHGQTTEDALAAGPRCLPLLPAACTWRMSPAFRAMDVEPRAKGILLEPFVHQVGGHSCVLRFNETTLCKPLVPREHQFADEFGASGNIETKEQGVVSVRFEEDEDRNLCLIAYPLKGDHGTMDSVDNSDCEPKSKLLRWTNKKHHVLETEKIPKDWVRQHRKEEKMKSHKLEEEFEWLKKSEVLYYSVEKKGNVSSQLKHYNPWSMKCHQQQLQRMKENAKHRNQTPYVGFKEALFQFFHNGRYLRRELLGPVLRKLTELKSVLERQESYRFYSSSLLVIYDGKERPEVALDSDAEDLEDLSEESADESAGAYAYKPIGTSSVDVRMIDFAHTTCRLYGEDSVVHEGQDAGYIFGLQSLIDIVTEISEESGE
ncbi:hypothetical protein E2I00_000579, partial [Balaenoptera physalus]